MQSVLRMDIDKMDMSMEIKTEALPNSLFVVRESSNECKELLRTLPMERNWDRMYQYQYHGF